MDKFQLSFHKKILFCKQTYFDVLVIMKFVLYNVWCKETNPWKNHWFYQSMNQGR